jgi:hypothetical protein
MLAAGALYRWDKASTEGNLSMMFSRDFAVRGGLRGGFGPLWRLYAWALERGAVIHCQSADPRSAIVGLGLGALAALDVFVQKQLAAWAQDVITRALQGAHFAAAADITVAAGGSQTRLLLGETGSLA